MLKNHGRAVLLSSLSLSAHDACSCRKHGPTPTLACTCIVQPSDGMWIKAFGLLWIFIWSEVHTLAKTPLLANKDMGGRWRLGRRVNALRRLAKIAVGSTT